MSELISKQAGYSAENYFSLVDTGELSADDHVELLDGVIVAEPPQEPRHASGTTRVEAALRAGIGERAVLRIQLPFIAGLYSVPEPDVAVVPGAIADYDTVHPTKALLVVEVSASSLLQDRLSKSRIYAAAEVPEYWLVNLRDDCVETYRDPDVAARVYRTKTVAHAGECLSPLAFPDVCVAVADLLPRRD